MRHLDIVTLLAAVAVSWVTHGQDPGQQPTSPGRQFSLGLHETSLLSVQLAVTAEPLEKPPRRGRSLLPGADLTEGPAAPPQPPLRITRGRQRPWRDLALGLGVLGLAAATDSRFWPAEGFAADPTWYAWPHDTRSGLEE